MVRIIFATNIISLATLISSLPHSRARYGELAFNTSGTSNFGNKRVGLLITLRPVSIILKIYICISSEDEIL